MRALKALLGVSLALALSIGICGCSRQQSDWQRARETNSAEAYEQFLKKYPSGEFTAQAQARLKDKYEERDWQKARDADTAEAYEAFLKQYPDGKDSEEARVRVENFTLAQTPLTPAGPGAPASPPSPAASPAAAPSAATPPAAPSTRSQKSTPQTAQGVHTNQPHPKSGSYAVQLGAFKSGTEAANRRWERLQRQYPKLFAGLSSKVVPKKTSIGTLYRLQAVGVTEAHARRICKSLKSKSQPCLVVPPAHA